MRDKLIELLKHRRHLETSELADWLLENGVVVVDVNIVPPPNRPLIWSYCPNCCAKMDGKGGSE